jgi:hypothetical protein
MLSKAILSRFKRVYTTLVYVCIDGIVKGSYKALKSLIRYFVISLNRYLLLYSSNNNIKNFFKVKSLSSAACLNCFLKDASILKFRSTVLPLSRLLLTLFSFIGGGVPFPGAFGVFAIGSLFRYFVKSVNLSTMFCNRASFVWLMLLNFVSIAAFPSSDARLTAVFSYITVLK